MDKTYWIDSILLLLLPAGLNDWSSKGRDTAWIAIAKPSYRKRLYPLSMSIYKSCVSGELYTDVDPTYKKNRIRNQSSKIYLIRIPPSFDPIKIQLLSFSSKSSTFLGVQNHNISETGSDLILRTWSIQSKSQIWYIYMSRHKRGFAVILFVFCF